MAWVLEILDKNIYLLKPFPFKADGRTVYPAAKHPGIIFALYFSSPSFTSDPSLVIYILPLKYPFFVHLQCLHPIASYHHNLSLYLLILFCLI